MMLKANCARELMVVIAVVAVLAAGIEPVRGQDGTDVVYRITVVSNLSEAEASDFRLQLESLGFRPALLDFVGDRASVVVGNYPDQAAAVRAKDQLANAGFNPGEIIEIRRGGQSAPDSGGTIIYRALAQEYVDALKAEQFKQRLQRQGMLNVEILSVPGAVQVTVGRYRDRNSAQNMVALLRDKGYHTGRVIETTASGTSFSPSALAQGTSPALQAPPDEIPIGLFVTSNENWRSLSEEQQRQVMEAVILQDEIRTGNRVGLLIEKLQRQIDSLDLRTREVYDLVTEERKAQAEQTTAIATMFRDAESLARGGRFQDAMLKIREILKLDPENTAAERRLRQFDMFMKGESYEGQGRETEKRYAMMIQNAEEMHRRGTEQDLRTEVTSWQQIKSLDPDKYGPEADEKIKQINSMIQRMTDEAALADEDARAQQQKIWQAVSGAVGLLAIIMVGIALRGRKRHKELMTKIHEITSVRPMRPIGAAAAAGAVGGGGGAGLDAPDEDLFGSAGGEGDPLATDPLAGDSFDTDPLAGDPPVDDPLAGMDDPLMGGADDDLFGEASPTDSFSPDDMAVDDPFADIGGTEAPVAEAEPVAAEPEPAAEPDLGGDLNMDDVFADLPSIDDSQTDVDGAGGAAEPPEAAPDSTESFVLDDIFSDDAEEEEKMEEPAAAPADSLDDMPSISFDDITSPSEAETAPPAAQPEPETQDNADPLAILEDIQASSTKTGLESPGAEAPAAQGVSDDTEIPPLSLDLPDADPFASLSDHVNEEAPSDDEAQIDAGSSSQVPTVNTPAAADLQPGDEITAYTFDADEPGSAPAGWNTESDSATLTVLDDNPPKGVRHYIRYSKPAGKNKVAFSAPFPSQSGEFTIEFDLRCNDKNKFLLGFYIQKDQDFQQAVHTKILRSEAQTAPMIHIQGEPAPYILGSWARLKYVINLKESKVDGYIDSTHIAKAIRLPEAPKYMNTLAIRDSKDTTGVLDIANIRIVKTG